MTTNKKLNELKEKLAHEKKTVEESEGAVKTFYEVCVKVTEYEVEQQEKRVAKARLVELIKQINKKEDDLIKLREEASKIYTNDKVINYGRDRTEFEHKFGARKAIFEMS